MTTYLLNRRICNINNKKNIRLELYSTCISVLKKFGVFFRPPPKLPNSVKFSRNFAEILNPGHHSPPTMLLKRICSKLVILVSLVECEIGMLKVKGIHGGKKWAVNGQFAKECWSLVGITIQADQNIIAAVDQIKDQSHPNFFMMVTILMCWAIWTLRNYFIFKDIQPAITWAKAVFTKEMKILSLRARTRFSHTSDLWIQNEL